MRQSKWRSTKPYQGYLLHDEVVVAADGRVHSVQWLAWPSASIAGRPAWRPDTCALSTWYFATIERLFHALVCARRTSAGIRLQMLGIPLLHLTRETVLRDHHRIEVGYLIDGGLLDATPAEKGRFCMKLVEWDPNRWRLAVEITRYRPFAVALVRSSLLYRLTQSAIHRWATFHFLRWCVDHADLLEDREARA